MKIKYDIKSQRPFYYVSKKDFAEIQLSQIPLHYENITLFAAQHDNIGTVALMKTTNMPVLFRGITIKEIMAKAIEQQISSQNYNDFQNELSITLDHGGGHFYATLHNETNYVYCNLHPGDYEQDQNLIKSKFNAIFSYQTCSLDHHNLPGYKALMVHNGSSILQRSSITSSAQEELYLSQFSNLKKPKEGEQTIRFKISSEQYASGFNAIVDLHNKCENEEVRYFGMFPNELDTENCFTSINRVVKAINIDTSYMKFFLDFQLLNKDDIRGNHFYGYKHQDEFSIYDKFHSFYQHIPISKYVYKGAIAIMAAVAEFQAIKYLAAPNLPSAPYVALLGNVLSLFQYSNDMEDEDKICHNLDDPNYVIVPCSYDRTYYKEGADQITYSYQEYGNPFQICLIDKNGMHFDVYINKDGNYERKAERLHSDNENFPRILCKEECIVEYQRVDIEQEIDALLGVVSEG